MNTIRNVWYYLIHTIRVAYYRLTGHTMRQEIVVGGQRFDISALLESMKPHPCKVCGIGIKHKFGQIVKYHPYCRKFKNNRYGFDPSKINA